MSKLKRWEEIEKEFNFTPEEDAQMQIEFDLIKALIEARNKKNITQRELSEMSGIKQPSIAKIESGAHSPQVTTLIKLLHPLGYTLKITPIRK